MPVQEHLSHNCGLPKLSLLKVEPQHLELLAVLAIKDWLTRVSLEPGQQLTIVEK